jgi:hypothetical protein
VTLTPAAAFFTGRVHASGSSATFELTNTGTVKAQIGAVQTIPTGGAFTVTQDGCSTPLAAGARCSIIVQFRALRIGFATGSLEVMDNAAGSPQSSSLFGLGY